MTGIRQKTGTFLFCGLISFCVLAVCSECSFLYAINDWYDPNCFFTVGKGMANGLLPYRDLFEQKGPLLYFLHMVAYLISNTSMLGVFVLEVFSLSVYLYFGYKLANLHVDRRRSLMIIPFLALITIASICFFKGDSAEEFCLPLLMISLYDLTRCISEERASLPVILRNGILAGCILWIKYTMLGFWFAWIFLFFLADIKHKRYGRAVLASFTYLAGMAIATIPWVIYFHIHQAVYDWLNTYFMVNMTVYAGNRNKLMLPVHMTLGILQNMPINPMLTIPTVMGFIHAIKQPGNRLARYAHLAAFLFLIGGIYSGTNRFPYYHLITAPFSVMGLVDLSERNKTSILIRHTLSRRGLAVLSVCVIVASALISFNKTQMRFFFDEESLPQKRFTKIIHQTDQPTLLNYGFLDSGFYTAADVLPVNRYFCRLNLEHSLYPEMMDEQNRIVAEAAVDYVILEAENGEEWESLEPPGLTENYDFVEEAVLDKGIEGIRLYALYRKKGLS